MLDRSASRKGGPRCPYTQVFGGGNIYPSDASFLHIVMLSVRCPAGLADRGRPRRCTRWRASSTSWRRRQTLSLTLPNATQSGQGQVVLFNNLTGSVPCFVRRLRRQHHIATLGVGERSGSSTSSTTPSSSPGIWHIFQFGASTATVQPSALAGYGLTVTGSTLSQVDPGQPGLQLQLPHALLDSDQGVGVRLDCRQRERRPHAARRRGGQEQLVRPGARNSGRRQPRPRPPRERDHRRRADPDAVARRGHRHHHRRPAVVDRGGGWASRRCSPSTTR